VETFWSLFKESVILQGLLTLGIWATIIYLVIKGETPPDMLINVGYTIIGFWFGTKVQQAVSGIQRQ